MQRAQGSGTCDGVGLLYLLAGDILACSRCDSLQCLPWNHCSGRRGRKELLVDAFLGWMKLGFEHRSQASGDSLSAPHTSGPTNTWGVGQEATLGHASKSAWGASLFVWTQQINWLATWITHSYLGKRGVIRGWELKQWSRQWALSLVPSSSAMAWSGATQQELPWN